VWHFEHVELYDPRSTTGVFLPNISTFFWKWNKKLADGQVGEPLKSIDRRIFETILKKKAFYWTIPK
jgi:hypothetical protein